MSDGFPRGQTAIVGAATHGIGEAPGFDSIDLAAHASVKALKQAGLTPALAEACGLLVKIPMAGRADSLNLAVATGVMLFEVMRERLRIDG